MRTPLAWTLPLFLVACSTSSDADGETQATDGGSASAGSASTSTGGSGTSTSSGTSATGSSGSSSDEGSSTTASSTDSSGSGSESGGETDGSSGSEGTSSGTGETGETGTGDGTAGTEAGETSDEGTAGETEGACGDGADECPGYTACVVDYCEAGYEDCYGEDWESGDWDGPCGPWTLCLRACPCDDADCRTECGNTPPAECASCIALFAGCANSNCGDELAACS